MWLEDPLMPGRYRIFKEVWKHVERLPGVKTIHSVGAPVGGGIRPHAEHLALLREASLRMNAPWVSEHLSFNATRNFNTGFFLPPRQTREGIRRAVAAIREFQAAMPVPIAVETGVNYLRARSDECLDGEFFASVVESADCGLLLDLHNLFANEQNGRESVEAVVARIPVDRIWEVHLAGGFEMDGYWLDSHSGGIPDALYDLSKRIIPQLPNLKALVFEIFPAFVPLIGLDMIRVQMERLQELRELHNNSRQNIAEAMQGQPSAGYIPGDGPSPSEWEDALGALVVGREAKGGLALELREDPGVHLLERLVSESRASALITGLRLTCRLLMLSLGADSMNVILQDYFKKSTPRLFTSSESFTFGDYLRELQLQVPVLSKVLEYEIAVLHTLLYDEARVVQFDYDPVPLLRALAEGRLPEAEGTPGSYEIALTSELRDDGQGLGLVR